MTREEATKYARSRKMMLESLIYNDDCKYGNYAMYSIELSFINAVLTALRSIGREKEEYAMYSAELSFINAVLSALRPVSREQIEKVWRGRWQRGTKDWVCSRCGRSHTFVKSFCPNCGAPMTDEAAQMVMERWKALENDN